jgi:hypothetical protein
MSENKTPNYPDILGFITNGTRYNVNVAQVALAVRPSVIRAGQAFEVLLLAQNAANVDVDLTVSLQMETTDAARKPNRFIIKASKLVIGMAPAEVGYITLPVNCLPDTAVSDQYKLSVTVDAKPLVKPGRVRAAEGGGPVMLEYLGTETVETLEVLKELSFSVIRKGVIGSVLETRFSVQSAQISKLVNLKAEWISLWRMSDLNSDRLLLREHGDVWSQTIMPQLAPDKLYKPLFDATQKRYEAAGFNPQPAEIHAVTKVMLTLLEMAAPKESYEYLGDEFYNVYQTYQRNLETGPFVQLPHWCKAYFKLLGNEPRAADHAAKVMTTHIYPDLLRDAIRYGIRLVQHHTEQKSDDEDQIRTYIRNLVPIIMSGNIRMSFSQAYWPLVLAGILLMDKATIKGENSREVLLQLSRSVKSRYPEIRQQEDPLYQMADRLIQSKLGK